MSITTTLEKLMESYATPFLTGAAYPYALPSITRISQQQYLEPSTDNNELSQPNTSYSLGHAAGAALTAILVVMGFHNVAEENDGALLLSTGITFLTTNIVSAIYELYLQKTS